MNRSQFLRNGFLLSRKVIGFLAVSLLYTALLPGGGLALVILKTATTKAVEGEYPKPLSAAIISPRTDLALESPSLKSKGGVNIS